MLAPFFDYIFVAQRDYVDRLKDLGYPTGLLAAAGLRPRDPRRPSAS